jgi:hydroxymethylpyrimidine pyrophosphatase-like HAD family hydrolase
LQTVAKQLEIDTDELFAIGDSENDISMFEVASESFAPANAQGPVKTAADHVLQNDAPQSTVDLLFKLNSHSG